MWFYVLTRSPFLHAPPQKPNTSLWVTSSTSCIPMKGEPFQKHSKCSINADFWTCKHHPLISKQTRRAADLQTRPQSQDWSNQRTQNQSALESALAELPVRDGSLKTELHSARWTDVVYSEISPESPGLNLLLGLRRGQSRPGSHWPEANTHHSYSLGFLRCREVGSRGLPPVQHWNPPCSPSESDDTC